MLNSNEEGAGFGGVPVKAIEAETEFFLENLVSVGFGFTPEVQVYYADWSSKSALIRLPSERAAKCASQPVHQGNHS